MGRGIQAETFRASDGYEFAYRRYVAAGTPKAHLVFAHGIRSHGGWYEKSCTELANRGFEVSFLDRRGAGLNDKDRGDCPSFRRLLDDIAEFIRSKKTTIPTVVAGISWGGKLAISLPAHAPGIVDRIVLITPGIVPLVSVPLATRLRIAAARFFNPTKRFPIPLNDPQLFTGSPHWQQFIEQDERGLREATARFLFNSVQLDFYLRRNLTAVNCPVLLLSAGKDRIADAAKSKAVLERGLKPGLLTEIVYAEAQHTLEFEEGCGFVEDMARSKV